uniref:Uncharacterized protein n=1 Tax=Glossina pallidipes TaxID=7398 RepID=A0A1B0AI45_GLOPL
MCSMLINVSCDKNIAVITEGATADPGLLFTRCYLHGCICRGGTLMLYGKAWWNSPCNSGWCIANYALVTNGIIRSRLTRVSICAGNGGGLAGNSSGGLSASTLSFGFSLRLTGVTDEAGEAGTGTRFGVDAAMGLASHGLVVILSMRWAILHWMSPFVIIAYLRADTSLNNYNEIKRTVPQFVIFGSGVLLSTRFSGILRTTPFELTANRGDS